MKRCLNCRCVFYNIPIKQNGNRCLCCGNDKFEDVLEDQFIKDFTAKTLQNDP